MSILVLLSQVLLEKTPTTAGEVNKDWEVTTGYGSIDKQDFDFTFSSSYIVVRIVTENAFYLCFNDYEHKKVSCFLPEKKDFLWHFTLQSLKQTHLEKMEKFEKNEMKINHFVGVMNDVLWLDIDVLNIGSFLLGLDTNTGKCAYFLDTVEHQNYLPTEKDFTGLPYTTFTTLDVKRNILFGFAPDTLHWQVDLSNSTIKMWSLKEEMTKHHAYVSAYVNCGISDSHIFFPVGSLGSTPQVFALNRETLKVDWQYHFIEGGQYFTPTKVEVTDTHLYVLDNTGTLHIFEKEENS